MRAYWKFSRDCSDGFPPNRSFFELSPCCVLAKYCECTLPFLSLSQKKKMPLPDSEKWTSATSASLTSFSLSSAHRVSLSLSLSVCACAERRTEEEQQAGVFVCLLSPVFHPLAALAAVVAKYKHHTHPTSLTFTKSTVKQLL